MIHVFFPVFSQTKHFYQIISALSPDRWFFFSSNHMTGQSKQAPVETTPLRLTGRWCFVDVDEVCVNNFRVNKTVTYITKTSSEFSCKTGKTWADQPVSSQTKKKNNSVYRPVDCCISNYKVCKAEASCVVVAFCFCPDLLSGQRYVWHGGATPEPSWSQREREDG